MNNVNPDVYVYPTSNIKDSIYLVIKKLPEGVTVLRAFTEEPPREALKIEKGETVETLKIALDYMDEEELT